ncbi:MAG: histidinol dehydrogenase [Alphaproteobacteria bacterium]|nr:histidinol dehydrogenase [Alphaproteobacteria bacterium]
MVHRLTHKDTDKLRELLAARISGETNVTPVVRDIIAEIRRNGDTALISYTKRFDEVILSPGRLRFTKDEIAKATAECDKEVYAALELAAKRIRDYHEKQLPKDERYQDADGVTLGWKYSPLASVGLYVPGGKASYPSSVLMNAIPAKVAGVERLVMVVPTPTGKINPAVLAAAQIAGVDEIYRIGGAQAVAALAYGTETIQPVDKIVGPGNAYVAEAKRQVFGAVGIDTIAGPSEILVVADARNEPTWIAADLLSQAEHDEEAQAILITNDATFADAVAQEIEMLLAMLPRREITSVSWKNHGAIIVVDSFADALPLIDMIAPEHLELAIEDAEVFASKVKRAGAIFLGRHTPEAIGDYIAGPSHVLPTSRAARFSSGLSVFDFVTRTSIIGCSPVAAKALAEPAAILADCEGLPAHALSLRLRTK